MGGLPVHQDQLQAQPSVTSMGSLFTFRGMQLLDAKKCQRAFGAHTVNFWEKKTLKCVDAQLDREPIEDLVRNGWIMSRTNNNNNNNNN